MKLDGRYYSSPSTLTDGQRGEVPLDNKGNLKVVGPLPTSSARLLSAAATTNGTNVKSSFGRIFKITGYNNKASAVFLKIYNKASAPTVGTDTPVLTIRLAATANFDIDLSGHLLDTGIGYGISGAAADNDTTALVAGDIVALNITYC